MFIEIYIYICLYKSIILLNGYRSSKLSLCESETALEQFVLITVTRKPLPLDLKNNADWYKPRNSTPKIYISLEGLPSPLLNQLHQFNNHIPQTPPGRL